MEVVKDQSRKVSIRTLWQRKGSDFRLAGFSKLFPVGLVQSDFSGAYPVIISSTRFQISQTYLMMCIVGNNLPIHHGLLFHSQILICTILHPAMGWHISHPRNSNSVSDRILKEWSSAKYLICFGRKS